MGVISEAVVQETWMEIGSFQEEIMLLETQKYAKKQPNLTGFMYELTEDMEDEAKGLALYLFFVVGRIFEKGTQKRIKKIPAKKIMKTFEANQDFLERLALVDERFLKGIAESETWEQPYVLKYVVEALVEAPEGDDPVHLTEEEFGYIFLLLKTVIDVLHEAKAGR
jgi:uncharacterized FlaG/YvyC family protein